MLSMAEENRKIGVNRTIVIGDIHGCFREFTGLLSKLQYIGEQDRLILIGDYIDRGPDSCKVVQFIRYLELAFGKEKVIALKGNHEDLLLDYMTSTEPKERCLAKYDWMRNGAAATIDSWEECNENIESYLEWFKSLRLFYETSDFYIVHAGVNPMYPLDNQKSEDRLWIRDSFINSHRDFGKTIVFGHTMIKGFSSKNEVCKLSGNKIAIDTGCVVGGKLSAIILPSLEVVDVPGRQINSKEAM